jgi:hypothetical protein
MRQDNRVALLLEALNLGEEIKPLKALALSGHGETSL